MRKVILVLILISFSSCWETLPDGRKYALGLGHCVKSHTEEMMEYNPALEVYLWETKIICDSFRYDTIWKK